MNSSILICGVGGQGTVLASKIIAQAAVNCGLPALASETIGMAQRGGCVVSHVRVGENVHSPLIPIGGADAVIAFEPGEAARCRKYLKDDGIMIVSSRAVQPVTVALSGKTYDTENIINYLKSSVKNLHIIDGQGLIDKIGLDKALNIGLVGVLCASGKTFLTLKNAEETIRKILPEKIVEINIKALRIGADEMEEK